MNNGYIKLHRKFTEWEWYSNINVKTLFIHCLLKANFKDKKYQGIKIDRGQFMTSINKLHIETGLSERQIRSALDKLILTNELTNKSNNKYRTITVINYNKYQEIDKQLDKQVTSELTNKRQTSDKQVTTTNKDKKEKKENKVIKKSNQKKFVIPTVKEIKDYCKERNNNVNPNKFFDFYESKGWLVGKNKMKNWKAAVRTWENNNKQVDNYNEDSLDKALGIGEYEKRG